MYSCRFLSLLQEGGSANAPEKPPQVVTGRHLESSDVESAVSEEKERQMEERRKEEEKHQVMENQLKRQGKSRYPNRCPFLVNISTTLLCRYPQMP